MSEYKVFESGSGKWVFIGSDGGVKYTSDKNNATSFDFQELCSANEWFADFLIYKNTMYVVAHATNKYPHDCPTVQSFIKSGGEFDG